MNKPIDILFVGEAPGEAEHACGKPFVGRAGQELDLIIKEALDPKTSYVITNAVMCTPFTDNSLSEIGTPTTEHINECRSNVHRLFAQTQPRYIVALGKVASTSIRKFFPLHSILLHPSAILQSTHYDLEHERAVILLKTIQARLNDA